MTRHRRGEGVHATVRKVDAAMASVNRMCRKFGTPKSVEKDLNSTKRKVGDLIARLELTERRQ
jgi:hypothetical protein